MSSAVGTFERILLSPRAALCLVVASVIAVSVLAYLPAVDNFFISDDFVLIPYLRVLDANPLEILKTPSEMFRMVSYVFFWSFLQLFGPDSEPWYWCGIGLHIFASVLLYRLVSRLTMHAGAGWAAALFFAAYERHQEAVMWISAFNDLILTVNCLLFLVLWEMAMPGGRVRTASYAAAMLMFAVALFSKEGAVSLFPLAILIMALRNYRPGHIVRWVALPAILLTAYLVLWVSLADKNFFVADGHYKMGLHFLPVYFRTFGRLLLPVLLFAVPLLYAVYRRGPVTGRTLHSTRAYSFAFFGAFLAISILPYAFLTYLNHIPSRNTYLPSAGLAGLVGLIFVMLQMELSSVRLKRLGLAFLLMIVAGNVMYIRTRKEAQYQERSAPTRELVALLNGMEAPPSHEKPVFVCAFPLDPWVGYMAVAEFTPYPGALVRISTDQCVPSSDLTMFRWDAQRSNYLAELPHVTD